MAGLVYHEEDERIHYVSVMSRRSGVYVPIMERLCVA